MLSLRKHFQQPKKFSKAAPSSKPFNVDEFIDLIVKKPARKTTWKEDRYIRRMVKENPKAAQAWQDAKETSPHEHFSLRVYPPLAVTLAAVLFVAISVAAGIYAFNRYYNSKADLQVEKKHSQSLRFLKERLSEVATMIEDNYARKVLFDRTEIENVEISGMQDTNCLVEDFLEDLRANGIDNYVDDKGRIHIK